MLGYRIFGHSYTEDDIAWIEDLRYPKLTYYGVDEEDYIRNMDLSGTEIFEAEKIISILKNNSNKRKAGGIISAGFF